MGEGEDTPAVTYELSPAKLAEYRAGAERRRAQAAERRRAHLARAQQVAADAAKLLRSEFGAQRVVLFGSTACPERFHDRSDVDLVAWGIEEHTYLRAVAAVNGLDSQMFVDLIRGEEAAPGLLAVLEQEGRAL